MATFFKIFFGALPVLVVLDLLWLGVVAKDFYRRQLGFLMTDNINWTAAIVFYLIFVAGLVIFVIAPAVEKGVWTQALLFGALFGFIAYATYDLTNLATLKDWPLLVTLVDMVWGATIGAAVSTTAFFISSKI